MKTDDISGSTEIEFVFEQIAGLVRTENRDLSLRQLAVLLLCEAAAEPQTVRGLARLLKISGPAVTRVVERLEKEQLVVRRPDCKDRRGVIIAPTSSGKLYCLQFFGRNPRAVKISKLESQKKGTSVSCELITPQNVQAARAALGWSQSKLASMVEMAELSIVRFERGKLNLPACDQKSLRSVFEAAGVTFIDGSGLRARVG